LFDPTKQVRFDHRTLVALRMATELSEADPHHPQGFGRRLDGRALNDLLCLTGLVLLDQELSPNGQELARLRGLSRPGGGAQLRLGFRWLSRAAQEVGLQEVPVAGKAGLLRRLFQKRKRLGFTISAAVRFVGLAKGAVGQSLRKTEAEVLGQNLVTNLAR